MGCALNSCVGAYPFRKTGIHFSGITPRFKRRREPASAVKTTASAGKTKNALHVLVPTVSEGRTMTVKTPEQDRNEKAIRTLYSLAEAKSKDTPRFVSMFADGGYFYDVAAGQKYYGADIGVTVDVYASAFPDMHRELYDFYFFDNVMIVELSLNGTHKGDLVLPAGTIPPTGKEMHAPCCDVFHLVDGKVTSFHCYVAVPILLAQLGVFMNLQAALRH
jgi:SnoaL-like domain